MPTSEAASSVAPENTNEEMAKRFEQVAIGQSRALRDFMLELSIGPTTSRWLSIVQPAVKALVEAAEPQRGEAYRRLTALERAMARATKAASLRIEGTAREGLLNEYKHLTQSLPAAFGLEQERNRREPMIVRQLLRQVLGVSDGLLEQLSSHGLDSLESLLRCSVDDLVARVQVDRDLATAIEDHLREYWKKRSEQALTTAEGSFIPKLRALIGALSTAHEAFQRAEEHEDRAAKRQARSERRFLALSVNVLLAQLGEVDLVSELEPLATEQKVQRVRMYLKQSALNDHAPQEEAS